jgi:hypothetical protein
MGEGALFLVAAPHTKHEQADETEDPKVNDHLKSAAENKQAKKVADNKDQTNQTKIKPERTPKVKPKTAAKATNAELYHTASIEPITESTNVEKADTANLKTPKKQVLANQTEAESVSSRQPTAAGAETAPAPSYQVFRSVPAQELVVSALANPAEKAAKPILKAPKASPPQVLSQHQLPTLAIETDKLTDSEIASNEVPETADLSEPPGGKDMQINNKLSISDQTSLRKDENITLKNAETFPDPQDEDRSIEVFSKVPSPMTEKFERQELQFDSLTAKLPSSKEPLIVTSNESNIIESAKIKLTGTVPESVSADQITETSINYQFQIPDEEYIERYANLLIENQDTRFLMGAEEKENAAYDVNEDFSTPQLLAYESANRGPWLALPKLPEEEYGARATKPKVADENLLIENVEEVEETISQLSERLEDTKTEEFATINQTVDKIAKLSSQLEIPAKPAGGEPLDEKKIQKELENLFVELFDRLSVEYSPQLPSAFAALTLNNQLEEVLRFKEGNEPVSKIPQEAGTYEFITKLSAGIVKLKRGLQRAYLLGKSALLLVVFVTPRGHAFEYRY